MFKLFLYKCVCVLNIKISQMDPVPQISQDLAMMKPTLQVSVSHSQPITGIPEESQWHLRICHVSFPSGEIQAEQAGDEVNEVLKDPLTLVSQELRLTAHGGMHLPPY